MKYTVPTWEGGLQSRISVLRRRRYSRLPWLDEILARLDLADGISRQLQQAGLPVRAGEFLFLQLVLGTMGGLIGALLGWDKFGGPLAALVGGLVGFVAPLGLAARARRPAPVGVRTRPAGGAGPRDGSAAGWLRPGIRL